MTAGRPTLLENGLVLTLDAAGTTGRLSLAIEGGRILDIAAPDALRARHPDAVRTDLDGGVVVPGLVNAHLHPELHVLRGAVEDLDLHAWAGHARLENALRAMGEPEHRWIQRAAIRAALAEALLSGTTYIATYGVTAGADEACIEALEALGLPGHVTIRDVAFTPAERVPATSCSPPRMYRLHAEEALTVAELRAAAAAHERGERIIMHAAETRHRVALARRRFGETTIRLLDRWGLLSPRVLLSHAVHIDEAEQDLIAERGAPVVASPAAEMKLSDGVAPLAGLARRGVTIALGTDAAVCNNGNDMLLECRLLALLQKLDAGAGAMTAEAALRCATAGGALALAEGGEGRGHLAPGGRADLVVLHAGTRLQPLVHGPAFSNVAANVVFSATGADVRDVMIGGRWAVRDRRLLAADADAILDELGRAAAALGRLTG
jgi:5-methylthioadenosine/S-adenosylhomocysteine deaminase